MAWEASQFLSRINRKKNLEEDLMETPLRRCLTTMDLLLLGIGHMVGAGLFVLTGTVVREVAGPASIFSYMVAGIAATFSSLCYAEFGARVPKAGSAYTYTYVTMGEIWAFIIGWNIILEHLLGVASVARAWSGSFDAIFDGAIKNGTLTYMGELHGGKWMSNYPDFIALMMIIVVMVFIAAGAKVSTNVNSIFTVINLLVIMLIIAVGLSLSDGKNWTNPKHGGFFPMGFAGVFAGAATCFYAYIGFEGIAVAGEEAKHPEKSIPVATGFSMLIVSLLYIGGAASLTLMVPYYTVDLEAPFSMAFEDRGMHWARLAVSIGALFGISTSLIGGIFSLPRSVYSMASDGLFFGVFAKVHPRTQTPILAIVFFGSISGLLALLVDINVLVEFLSIGTLLSFTIVAAGVLILRYQPVDKCQFKLKPEHTGEDDDSADSSDTKRILRTSQSHNDIGKLKDRYVRLPYIQNLPPGWATVGAVVTMFVFMVAFWALLLHGYHYVSQPAWWALILLIVFTTGIIVPFLLLLAHEQNESFITFQVPCVPLVPSLSMFINIAMMMKLNPLTWIRLAIWMTLGFFIYFLYGMHHSKENRPLSAYSQIVSYAGTSSGHVLPEGALPEPGAGIVGPSPGQLLQEKVQPQQPKNELRDISEEEDS